MRQYQRTSIWRRRPLPPMQRQKSGHIITELLVRDPNVLPRRDGYCDTKAAVAPLTEGLRDGNAIPDYPLHR